MIDEDRTESIFGYRSADLSLGSHKKIVVVCEGCGKKRLSGFRDHKPFCHPCSMKQPEVRAKLAVYRGEKHAAYGKTYSQAEKLKMSQAQKGRKFTGEHVANLCGPRPSITGENNPNWGGGVNAVYCNKFTQLVRTRVRDKYDNRCFICGLPEELNITKTDRQLKLSVHHVDMNKQQGCDDHMWKLVPLCMTCHGMVHNELWQARLEYIIKDIQGDE